MQGGEFSQENIQEEVIEAIRNPTDRMRKSFQALPLSHKWMLIALLESERVSSDEKLRQLYESQCPMDVKRSPDEIIEELTESFIRVLPSKNF